MRVHASERRLNGLYESLARYHWIRRRFSRAAPGDGLEMHKRLLAPEQNVPGPGAGHSPLNSWLLAKLGPHDDQSVLDVGCGFGATLLAWARQISGSFVGLSPSRFQVRGARAESLRLGLADRCTFRVQSYDDPIDGRFDTIVSIESLFHSPNLTRTLRNVASCAKVGGVLVLLEDMASEDRVEQDPAATELLRRWSTQRLHTADGFRRALHDAGFELREEIDLTEQVAPSGDRELAARERRLRLLATVAPLPGWRRLFDAFLGGIALERLYAKGSMRYRTMIATRSGDRR